MRPLIRGATACCGGIWSTPTAVRGAAAIFVAPDGPGAAGRAIGAGLGASALRGCGWGITHHCTSLSDLRKPKVSAAVAGTLLLGFVNVFEQREGTLWLSNESPTDAASAAAVR